MNLRPWETYVYAELSLCISFNRPAKGIRNARINEDLTTGTTSCHQAADMFTGRTIALQHAVLADEAFKVRASDGLARMSPAGTAEKIFGSGILKGEIVFHGGAPVNFQSSLRDFSTTAFLPRTASWAKFTPSLRDLYSVLTSSGYVFPFCLGKTQRLKPPSA
jgi:hypothetical protein